MDLEFEKYLKDVGNEVVDNIFIEENGFSLEIVNFISYLIDKSANGAWKVYAVTSNERLSDDMLVDIHKTELEKYSPFIFYDEEELNRLYKMLTDSYVSDSEYSVLFWVTEKSALTVKAYFINKRDIIALTAEKLIENRKIIENILESYDKSTFYLDSDVYEKTSNGDYRKLDSNN